MSYVLLGSIERASREFPRHVTIGVHFFWGGIVMESSLYFSFSCRFIMLSVTEAEKKVSLKYS